MVSQDIDKNKDVESTNTQELEEEQMEKSHDEKLLEELIDRQQIL